MNRKIFQIAWAAVLVISATLACNFLTTFTKNFGEARSTAVSVFTQAQGIITQAEGLATAFDESGAVETAKALVTERGPAALATLQALGTQVEDSGAMQTVQAALTEQGPEALATVQALATQAADSGAMQTAQALVTQESSDLLATVQALPTLGFGLNEPPEDIPLLDSNTISNLLANQNVVSYLTTEEFRSVVSFYKDAMPGEGWSLASSGNLELDNLAIMNYTKGERKAAVTILKSVLDGQTAITILIGDNS